MRKRRKLLIILACLAIIAGTARVLTLDREPRYQGRALSEWHLVWNTAVEYEDSQNQTTAREAEQAIRTIGTNAIPTLLKRLRSRPSKARLLLQYLIAKLPDPVLESAIFRPIFSDRQALGPTSTFVILGPIASPAVPRLTALLCDTDADVARSAAYCLAAIGKDGLPPLLEALRGPQQPGCYAAADILSLVPLGGTRFVLGTNLAKAVPLLANIATNKDSSLAQISIKALDHLKAQPQIAIPALTAALDSRDFRCPIEAVRSLVKFGPEAISPLQAALEHTNVNVRSAATNGLRFMARAALTNTVSR